MINFNAPKGLGVVVGNLMRQFVLSETETPRIVGFSFGEQTLLTSGDIDLVSFSAELAGLDLEVDPLIGYPCSKEVNVKGCLKVSDLKKCGIVVLNRMEDEILLDTFGEVNIMFVVNKCKVYTNSSDNRNLLQTAGLNVTKYNIISSRPSDLKVFVDVKNNLHCDDVTFKIDSSISKEVLKESIDKIITVFGEISHKIS